LKFDKLSFGIKFRSQLIEKNVRESDAFSPYKNSLCPLVALWLRI